MADCFDCGLRIHADHVPRMASGQTFHPTPSHCVSALLADRARLAGEVERLRDELADARVDQEQWKHFLRTGTTAPRAEIVDQLDEVARLTSDLADTQSRLRNAISDSAHFYEELAAARENEEALKLWVCRNAKEIGEWAQDLEPRDCTLPQLIQRRIDAARSAGGEG